MADPDAQAAYALAEALRLVKHGYQLTPVTITRDAEGNKRAQFHKGWRHEDAWSNDPGLIRAWWVDRPCSFAIRTGAAGGVDVIDLDVKADKDGVTWWAEQGHPLGSMIVNTPSGGLHMYVPNCGLPTSASQFGPGVDTRGDGGLVFAPGAYIEGEPGRYEVQGALVAVHDLTPLPDELAAAIRASTPDSSKHRTDGAITMKDYPVAVQLTRAAVDKVAAMPLHTAGSTFRDAQMGAAMMLGRLAEAGACDVEWAREQIEAATLQVWPNGLSAADEKNIESGLRDGPRKERWRWRNPDQAASDTSGADAAEPELSGRGLLPRETWDRSAVLNHIYRAAMATLTCPDAVLYSVLAIIASYVHHGSRVQTGVRPSTLSFYFTAIGTSGGGKSEALSVARDLLERWCEDRFAIHGGDGYFDGPVGSGEGLVEAFMGEVRVPVMDPDTGEQKVDGNGNPETKKGRGQARHNALFHSDEGRQVLAIDSRKGATVLAILCEMWSGSVAGQTNADKDRTRRLGRGTYVLGLLLGFQPATIDALFDDAAGGAPQRFAFAPVAYPPHADAETFVEWPGCLVPDIPVTPLTVELKAEHRAEVRAHRRLKAAGKVDEANPLDGHRMLLRVRTAALLALLHGVTAVDDDLWEMAGLMVERSCILRDHLAGQAQRRAQQIRRARQDEAVETHTRATAADEYRARVQRAADSLVRFLEKNGRTRRGTAKAGITSSVRRTHGDAAIEKLISDGVVISSDGWWLELA